MSKLKKIVLKFPIPSRYTEIFDLCEKIEVLQVHRLSKNYFIATIKFVFKTNESHPKHLIGMDGIKMNEILSQNEAKNEFICFTRYDWDEELQHFFNIPDIIITPPIILEECSFRVTYISTTNNVDVIIEQYRKQFGDQLKILNITPIQPDKKNLSLILTERQKEIIYYAIENGYYEIPREITSTSIANHFKISRSALYEHLRKIERTLFLSIFQ